MKKNVEYMQTVLLNDIELDIRELRNLLDAATKEPEALLREVAIRRISRIQNSLNELSATLGEEVQTQPEEVVKQMESPLSLFSINDSFLFSRELFGGDTGRMNVALQKIGEMDSLGNVERYLADTEQVDKENEAYTGFIEILAGYFTSKP